jgi:hypothetical protein
MFFELANCCQQLCEASTRKIKPITDHLKNGVPHACSPWCTKVVQDFKNLVIRAPIIKHFEPMRQIEVESNASEFAISSVLSKVIDG